MNTKRRREPPIPPDLEARLLESLAPLPPPRGRGASLKRRILARTQAPAPRAIPTDFVTVRLHDGAWRQLAPDVFEKPLVTADGLVARLIRMAPGAVLPAHDHDSDEESVVLEGEVWLGEEFCVAGEFHFAPRGLSHAPVRTGRGCLLYVRSGGHGSRAGTGSGHP